MSGNIERKDLPAYNLFGASNAGGLTFLSPFTAQGEKFGISDGFSAVTIEGLNGKGEAGKENPINKLNLGAELDEVGQSILVTNRLITARRVVFSDLADKTLSHVLYFDHRRDTPIGYFTEKNNGEIDGTASFTTTQKDASAPVVLKAKTITKEQLSGAVRTIVTAFNKAKDLTMREGFGAEISKHNLMQMPKDGDKSLFISLFDAYFEPTEANIKAIKSILPELEDDVIAPPITAFKDGVSKSYNMVELNGITVKNTDAAILLNNLISGNLDHSLNKEGANRLLIESKAFFDKQENLRFSIQTEEEIIVGVDTTGSIFVLENSNIPRKSGGDIYKTEISPLVAPFRANLNTIKNKYKDDGTGKYVPDDNAVIQAEQSLRIEAMRLATLLGEAEVVSKILGNMQNIAGAINNKATNDKAGMAMAQANSLFTLVETALIKGVVSKSDLVKDNMLTTNGQRIRQQYHSNHKKNNPLERWDGVEANSVEVVALTATLPTLVFPPKGKDEAGVANFKESKSDVMNIYVNKDGSSVLAVDSQNDISFWNKHQARVGKILNAILRLDPEDEKLETKLKNFVNFGGKLGDKATNFGLLALKKEENAMSHTFGELFQEMRALVYNGDVLDLSKLSVLQNRISGLSQSKDRNEKQLGLYAESVSRNLERNRLLTQGFYVVASNENSKRMVDFMSSSDSALKGLEAYPVKAIKDTALVIRSSLNGIKGVIGNTNLINTAKQIGWNIINSQRLTRVSESRDKTKAFIQTPSSIKDATIAKSSIFENKMTSFNRDVLSLIGSANPLDISEGLENNSKEYHESKPTYDYANSMGDALLLEEDNSSALDVITLDMTSLSSMGVQVIETEKVVVVPREEEISELSAEEKEEFISDAEMEKGIFDSIPAMEMDELSLALEQHSEEERVGAGISGSAKEDAKSKGKTMQAPTLNLQ